MWENQPFNSFNYSGNLHAIKMIHKLRILHNKAMLDGSCEEIVYQTKISAKTDTRHQTATANPGIEFRYKQPEDCNAFLNIFGGWCDLHHFLSSSLSSLPQLSAGNIGKLIRHQKHPFICVKHAFVFKIISKSAQWIKNWFYT